MILMKECLPLFYLSFQFGAILHFSIPGITRVDNVAEVTTRLSMRLPKVNNSMIDNWYWYYGPYIADSVLHIRYNNQLWLIIVGPSHNQWMCLRTLPQRRSISQHLCNTSGRNPFFSPYFERALQPVHSEGIAEALCDSSRLNTDIALSLNGLKKLIFFQKALADKHLVKTRLCLLRVPLQRLSLRNKEVFKVDFRAASVRFVGIIDVTLKLVIQRLQYVLRPQLWWWDLQDLRIGSTSRHSIDMSNFQSH